MSAVPVLGFNGAVDKRRRRATGTDQTMSDHATLQWGRRQASTERSDSVALVSELPGFNGAVDKRRRRDDDDA